MSQKINNDNIIEKDRIIYIEPNELAADANNVNCNNISWNQEDLMMSVDLQVIIPSNDDCGQINYFVKEKELIDKGGVDSVWTSFMTGNLDYQDKKYITTDYTNISYSEYENGKVVSKEDLGIKSINIDFDAHFYPIVTMQMTDVRGNSLFLPSEYDFQQKVTGGDDISDAKRSFFRALFRFPYPRFLLSVKGFYGNKITFTLAVSDFKTQFNSESGDFDVTVKFIGYVYGAYSDLPMDLIMSSPIFNLQYWQNNDAFHYREGGMRGERILNYIDYLKKYTELNSVSGDTIPFNENEEYNNLIEQNEFIKKFKKKHKDCYDELLKKCDGSKCQIIKGDKYDLVVIYSTHPDWDYGIGYNYKVVVEPFDEDYKKMFKEWQEIDSLFDYELTNNEMKRYISISLPNNATSYHEYLGYVVNFKKNKDNDKYYQNNEDGNLYYDGIEKEDYDVVTDFLKKNEPKIYNNIVQGKIDFGNDIPKNVSYVGYRILDKTTILDRLTLFETNNNKHINEIENNLSNKVKQTFNNVLKSNQSVENMYRMLFAHIDCFMEYFYNKINTINGMRETGMRSATKLGLNKDNSDIRFSDSNTFIAPFPAYYIKKDGKRIMEFPGYAENNRELRSITEVEMVKNIIYGILSVRYQMDAIFDEGKSEKNAITIIDLFKETVFQPWKNYTLNNDMSTKDIRQILYIIACEFLMNKCYDYNTFDDDDKINKWLDCQVDKFHNAYLSSFYNVFQFIHQINEQLKNLDKDGWYNVLTTDYGESNNLIMDLTNSSGSKFLIGKEKVVGNYTSAFGGKNDNNVGFKMFDLPEIIIGGYNDSDYKLVLSNEKFNKYSGNIKDCGISEVVDKVIDNENVINHLYLNGDSGAGSVYSATTLDLWAYNNITVHPFYERYGNRTRVSIDNMTDCNFFNKGKKLTNNDDVIVSLSSYKDFPDNIGLSFPFVHIFQNVYTPDNFNSEGMGRRMLSIFDNKNNNNTFKHIIENICSESSYSKSIMSGLTTYDSEKNGDVEKTWWRFGYFLLSLICNFNLKTSFKKFIVDNSSKIINVNKTELLLFGAFLTVKEIFFKDYCMSFRVDTIGVITGKFLFGSDYEIMVRNFNNTYGNHIKCFYTGTDENNFMNFSNHIPIFTKRENVTPKYNNVEIQSGQITYDAGTDDLTKKLNNVVKENVIKYYKEWINELVDNYQQFIDDVTLGGAEIEVKLTPDYNIKYPGSQYKKPVPQQNKEKTPVFPKGSTGDVFFTNLYTERVTVCLNKKTDKAEIDIDINNVLNSFGTKLINKLKGIENPNNKEYLGDDSIKDAERKLYYVLKNLYNKWLSTYKFDNWKLGTIEEDFEKRRKRFSPKGNEKVYNYSENTEFNNFLFIDQFYSDISNSFIIDPKTIYDTLEHYSSGNLSVSVYHFMHLLAEKNKLMMLSLPIYNNLYDSDNFKNVFTPHLLYGNNDNTNHYGSSYVLMYMNKASQHSDYSGDNNYNFNNDYIDFAGLKSSQYTPISEFGLKSENSDELNYKVAAFAVTFSKQNQMYFKKIDVAMDSSKATNESMSNLLMLSDAAGKNGVGEANVTIGQDVYSIYANRSYMCKVEMMGCMNIMPLMYFQLNNIPLFRGAYMITNVSHSITQGNIVTSFSGVRVSRYLQPQVDTHLVGTYIKRILDNSKSNSSNSGNGNKFSNANGTNNVTGSMSSIWNKITMGDENKKSTVPYDKRFSSDKPGSYYKELIVNVEVPIFDGDKFKWKTLAVNKHIKNEVIRVFNNITFGCTLNEDEIANHYMDGEAPTSDILSKHKYLVTFEEDGKKVSKIFRFIQIGNQPAIQCYRGSQKQTISKSYHSVGVAIDINKNLDFTDDSKNADYNWKSNVEKYKDCPKNLGNPDLGPKERENLFTNCPEYAKDTDVQIRTWSHPVVRAFLEQGFGWGIFNGSRYDYMHFSYMTSDYNGDDGYTNPKDAIKNYPTITPLKVGH